jgi:hypothetical protein
MGRLATGVENKDGEYWELSKGNDANEEPFQGTLEAVRMDRMSLR